MRKALSTALLLLQFILVSCHKDDVGPTVPIVGDIPLQVGNEWVYKVSYYDDNGEVLNSYTSRRTVLRDTIIDKTTWYILSTGSIVRHNREGYVYYNVPGKQAVILYPNIDFGGSIGYMYKYSAYDLWVLTIRTFQTHSLTTAIDVYDTYTFNINYEYYYPVSDQHLVKKVKEYVAPGIGMVRADTYHFDSDVLQKRYELVSYTLN